MKTNHKIDLDNVTVIDTENRYLHRKIKEAIWIRTQKPNMNRETGIQLSHIYDTLLTAPQQSNRHQPITSIVQY